MRNLRTVKLGLRAVADTPWLVLTRHGPILWGIRPGTRPGTSKEAAMTDLNATDDLFFTRTGMDPGRVQSTVSDALARLVPPIQPR